MDILHARQIFSIFRKTLSLIDYRLIEHSERVAYITMRMLMEAGFTDHDTTARYAVIALLHDIGAYKTQGLNSLTGIGELAGFELRADKPHCVYGHLFIRYFSSLNNLSDAILYHHTRFDHLEALGCQNKELASFLAVSERFDIVNSMGRDIATKDLFHGYVGTVFSKQAVQALLAVDKDNDLKQKLNTYEYMGELADFVGSTAFGSDELLDLLNILVFLIDIRSPYTVIHTVMTTAISTEIAKHMQLCEKEIETLHVASLLHDIGKIATPISILEKEGKLTPKEFDVMKDHVTITKYILEHCVDNEIMQTASRHHEKLDGTGYPYGLKDTDLTLSQKILAVADICSALIGKRSYKNAFDKNKVLSILQKECQSHKLSNEVVQIVCVHYDTILSSAQAQSQVPLQNYQNLTTLYPQILHTIETGGKML